MCQECHMTPCHPRCPNAPDPTPVTHCCRCGEPIIPGDEYGIINGLDYCADCIDDMPYCELIPLLGGEWKTVQEGEIVKCCDCNCTDENGPLEVGEEYAVIDGNAFCEACVDEIPYCDLLDRFGFDWKTASEEDIYDGYDG